MAAVGATCGGLSDDGVDATRVNQFRFIGAFLVLALVLRIAAPALMRVPRVAWRP